jgi:hypothetical protein
MPRVVTPVIPDDADVAPVERTLLRRALPWVRAAFLGAFVVTLLGEIGYGSFTPALVVPGVIVGSLAGVTSRAVRLWRSWLGAVTVWVLVALVWGLMTWVLLRTAPRCPLEDEAIRCSPELSATWAVNVALAVAVLMLLVEPPRMMARAARAAWRAKGRKKRESENTTARSTKKAGGTSRTSSPKTNDAKKTSVRRDAATKKKKKKKKGARDAR